MGRSCGTVFRITVACYIPNEFWLCFRTEGLVMWLSIVTLMQNQVWNRSIRIYRNFTYAKKSV